MTAVQPRVVSIVYTPKGILRRPQDHYTRVPVASVQLIEFRGIDGDMKGGTGKRQINVMNTEILEQLQAEGFRTEPGQLGEQIVIAGIPPGALTPGVRLRLGGAAIEVTIPRTGCERFETIQGRPRSSVEGRLGVLARVVSGGEVSVGDTVEIIEI